MFYILVNIYHKNGLLNPDSCYLLMINNVFTKHNVVCFIFLFNVTLQNAFIFLLRFVYKISLYLIRNYTSRSFESKCLNIVCLLYLK